MGIFKLNFYDILNNIYSELESISFSSEFSPLTLKDYNLKYYYSTIVNKKANNSSVYYHFSCEDNNFLTPFYIALGIYSSTIKKNNINEFKNLKDYTEVFYNSSRHNFYRINFDTHKIEIKGNIGYESMSFENFLEYCRPQKLGRKSITRLRAYEKKDEKNFNKIKSMIEDAEINLSKSIEKYLKIMRDKDNFIPDSGVIFFTKKADFKEYINKLFLNDSLLKDLIPISEAKSKGGANYNYQNLGIKEKKPIIVITGYRDINAAEIFRENYPYLDNLVIDDFDFNDEEYINIVEKYSGSFKNIFLISNNNSFSKNKIYNINQKFDSYKYWFTSDLDFKDNPLTEPLHKTYIVHNKKLNEINNKFKGYPDKFKELREFCSYESLSELIKITYSFYNIKTRFFSFNDPGSLEDSIEDFKNKLNVFWVDNSLKETYGDNTGVLNFMDELKVYNKNEKSEFIVKFINEKIKEIDINTIKIVTNNTNSEDLNFLMNTIKNLLPDVIIEIIDFKTYITKTSDVIIFFGIYPNNKNIFFRKFAEKQLILLSEHEYPYYERVFYYLKKDLNNICSTKERKKESFMH